MIKPRMAVAYHFFNDPDTSPAILEGVRVDLRWSRSRWPRDYMVWNITRDEITTRMIRYNPDAWPPPGAKAPPPVDRSITKYTSDWIVEKNLDVSEIVQDDLRPHEQAVRNQRETEPVVHRIGSTAGKGGASQTELSYPHTTRRRNHERRGHEEQADQHDHASIGQGRDRRRRLMLVEDLRFQDVPQVGVRLVAWVRSCGRRDRNSHCSRSSLSAMSISVQSQPGSRARLLFGSRPFTTTDQRVGCSL